MPPNHRRMPHAPESPEKPVILQPAALVVLIVAAVIVIWFTMRDDDQR